MGHPHLYDRKKFPVLLLMITASALSAPLVFLAGPVLLTVGMVLWGIGMGAQESIIRAVVADIVPRDRRATGYGIFMQDSGLPGLPGAL